MSVWSERSCWASTVWLDIETTSRVTGLKADTIYHYGSRNDPRFPKPTTSVGRIYFSGDQIFRYILDQRPSAQGAVPRLYPRVADPAPALFVEAHSEFLPDVGSFAVHIWQPGDGGARIAIAYPDRLNTMHYNNVADTAAELLRQISPQVAALAMPTSETVQCVTASGAVEDQPTLVVAERNQVYRPDPIGSIAARYNWSDLANLLRVDIPWWAQLFRDLDVMLSWRPGAPAGFITPFDPTVDTGHITALVDSNDSEVLRAVADKLATRTIMQLNGCEHDDGRRLTPGLLQAAVSTVDATQPVPTLSAGEVALLLHHRASQHAATHALRVVDHWAFVPILTHAIRVNRASVSSMARQWVSRLVDVAEERRTELGFWFVNNYVASGVRPVRWLADPDNANSWIIQGDNAVVYAGVGTATPGACGQLVVAEVDDEAAFFRDSTGQVWPLPDAGYQYYRTGYEGGGPLRLAETVTTLLDDAAADVFASPKGRPTAALYQLVTTHQAPVRITAD